MEKVGLLLILGICDGKWSTTAQNDRKSTKFIQIFFSSGSDQKWLNGRAKMAAVWLKIEFFRFPLFV
jgi:hypothetical protein